MMPVSNSEKEFVSYVVDLMPSIGPVTAKRMFGGHGVFLEGLMFALISDGTLYFKVDTQTKSDFVEKGLEAFTYQKKDKVMKMSYFNAPEETMEDVDVMNLWANKAYSVALRAASKKNRN
jgi:DNA transformation protein